MNKSKAASELGKRSAEKQFGGMTKEQKSEYFKNLRSKRKDKTTT